MNKINFTTHSGPGFFRAKIRPSKDLILNENKHWIIDRLLKLFQRKPAPRPWHTTRRPAQTPPEGEGWRVWLISVGRGWGKTWTASNWLAEQAARNPNTTWAFVAPTWADARKISLEGTSGILAALLPGELKYVNHSDLSVTLNNGSRILGYSGDRPDRLRGFTKFNGAWVDEIAAMGKAAGVWELLTRAVPTGQIVITTTPRPIPLLLDLLADPSVIHTAGPTWDNQDHLSTAALNELRARYGQNARQELEGEVG